MGKQVEGFFEPKKDAPNTIIITTNQKQILLDEGNSFEDLRESIYTWFVDKRHFNPTNLLIYPIIDEPLSAELEFVGEDITMAKLQGYID